MRARAEDRQWGWRQTLESHRQVAIRSHVVDEKSPQMPDVPRCEATLGPPALRGRLKRRGEESASSEKPREEGERLGRESCPKKAPYTHGPLLWCECWGSTITPAHATPHLRPDMQALDWGP